MNDYQELSDEYQSVSLRYDKSILAIERKEQYQSSIVNLQKAVDGIGSQFGESVNIDSYKLTLQQEVESILTELGLSQEKFGWRKELTQTVGNIYSGTLSLRFRGDTAATILAMSKLEGVAKVSTLSSFTSTIQGYQFKEFDLGLASVNVELTIWVKAL